MTNYKIIHTGGEYIARVCHGCKKINLGHGYRNLPKEARRFILLHEIGHSLGLKSELDADNFAMNNLIKQGYSKDYYNKLLLSLKLRTKQELDILNNN